MPNLKDVTEEISKTARDALYVAVGLGVLGFQRAQVRRQELVKQLGDPRAEVESRLGEVRGKLTQRVKEVDDLVEGAIGRLEATFAPLEQRLPDQARALVEQARTQARDARQQIRTLLLSDAA